VVTVPRNGGLNSELGVRNVAGEYSSVHQSRVICTAKHQKAEQGFVEGSVGGVGQVLQL
jgi:hypothetical protein